jgi:hypothetical protein
VADTVWCASSDAGLLRYTPSTRQFVFELHEPGGLASNLLSTLEFDHGGRLWVGTMGSGASILGRDRSTWALVNSFDGLRSDSVTTLTAQGDTMWIGTTAGLALWDGVRVEGTLPDGVNPSPFASDRISGIDPIGDTLWVATAGGVYLSRLSQGLATWTAANGGLPSLTVAHLVSDGHVPFALSASQVLRFDPGTGQWSGTGSIGTVRTLIAHNGDVLAATSSGIYRWNGSGFDAIPGAPASSSVSPIVAALDETGRAYAAGQPIDADAGGNGIYREADAGPWTFDLPPGPPGNNCVNLELRNGALYVATLDDGIGRLRGGAWTQWFPTPAPYQGTDRPRQPQFPFGMSSDGGTWFMCWAGISVACEPDTGTLEILDDSGPDSFHHVKLGPDLASARLSWARGSAVDPFRRHWFGLVSPCDPDIAPGGFVCFDSTGSFVGNFTVANNPSPGTLLSDLVPALVTDANGRVWGGTGKGIVYWTPTVSDPMPALTHIAGTVKINGLATFKDSLWVLTDSELQRYRTTDAAFLGHYNIPGSPSVQSVRTMDVGRDGTLWFGHSGGVRAYRRDGSVDDYTTANSPLANNDVHAIRVDGQTGAVWMATAGGISKLDPFYVPPSTAQGSLSFSVYPNPARVTAVGLPIRLSGNASSYHGLIFDLNGRRIRKFSASANGRVVWDCRDEHGNIVGPGIYFVRAESGGQSGVERIVLLH